MADIKPKPAEHDDDLGGIERPEFDRPMWGTVGRGLKAVFEFPVRLLLYPFSAASSALRGSPAAEHERLPDDPDAPARPNLLGQGLGWLVKLPFLILFSPIRLVMSLGRGNLREAAFILPALLMLLFLGYVLFQNLGGREIVRGRYLKGIQTALAEEDFQKAKTYFQRLREDGKLNDQQKFNWMIVLSKTGEPERAAETLDELAPDQRTGFGPAHRIKAIQLALEINQMPQAPASQLQQLEHHLAAAEDRSPELLELWAMYHQRMGEDDDAIAVLKEAADANPVYFLAAADYQKRIGRTTGYQRTLKDGEQSFRKMLDDDPLNHRARIALANLLSQQEDYDQAESLLLGGYKLANNDPLVRRALAGFYTMRHDQARKQNAPIGEQLKYLIRSLSADPNFPKTYESLMAVYVDQERSPQERAQIRTKLQELVAGDQPNPMAHFSLSNVLWAEGNTKQAEFHLQQARKLAPEFVPVLNNLAWMMSERENPDLEQALKLVNEALDAEPENPKYLDTRGSILLRLKRYRDAIVDLEKAVQGVDNPALVHQKLAEAYQALEMDEIAELHRSQAAEK